MPKACALGLPFYEASIRSKARLIYEAVALHLSGESRLDIPKSVVESLDAANDLLALLLKTRALARRTRD